jgi:two-component system response regulator PilR (NtrC family)
VLRAAKRLRPHVKAIMITAYPSPETAAEAMNEGIVDYLPKPVDLSKLERLVREPVEPGVA